MHNKLFQNLNHKSFFSPHDVRHCLDPSVFSVSLCFNSMVFA